MNRKTLVIFSLMVTSLSLQSMHRFSTCMQWMRTSHRLRKACKVGYWGLLLYPFVKDLPSFAFQLDQELEIIKQNFKNEMYLPPNNGEMHFIHRELLKRPNSDKKIWILYDKERLIYHSTPHAVFLGLNEDVMNNVNLVHSIFFKSKVDIDKCRLGDLVFKQIQAAVKYNEGDISAKESKSFDRREELINIHRFCLHHELSHIENNDAVKSVAAMVVAPFLSHWSLRILGQSLKFISRVSLKHLLKTNGITGFKNPLWLLPNVLFKVECSKIGIKQFKQHQEFLADDGVIDELPVLIGGMQQFQSRIIVKRISEEINFWDQLKSRIYATHPSDERRLARLKKRVDNLMAKQTNL